MSTKIQSVWRGDVKSVWQQNGLGSDLFKVMTRMRGSSTRFRLLQLLTLPKNTLQLSTDLGMSWRTISAHLEILREHELIKEMAVIGTSKYYILSQKGMTALDLLSDGIKTQYY